MITFPRSKILEFYKTNPDWKAQGKRLGQAFYDFMHFEEITEPEAKAVCDSLYQVNSQLATRIIIDHTDWNS